MTQKEAIAAHLKAHDAKILKRIKDRRARAERNKKRGLSAAITRIKAATTISALAVVLLLGACAQDSYTLANGDPIRDKDTYDSTLYHCKTAAVAQYHDGGLPAGMFLTGAIGGVLAAPIVIAADMQNDDGMKLSDINPAVEKCMAQKGYNGTSR